MLAAQKPLARGHIRKQKNEQDQALERSAKSSQGSLFLLITILLLLIIIIMIIIQRNAE